MARSSNLAAREDRILEILQAKGTCTYAELQEILRVSSMTVRRDVDRLAQREALIKTLRGAQAAQVPQFLLETSLSSRIGVNQSEKERIATSALTLIEPQRTLYLDGGTTCIALARRIAKLPFPLSVVTNSALVAMEIGAAHHIRVICVGGEYDAESASFVGSLAEANCAHFYIDTAFTSTWAFQPGDGTYESSMARLRIKQIVAKQCSRLVLLTDSSKFGRRALCKVLDARAIHTVITDERCPREAVELMRSLGHSLTIAREA
jgi:DeoR/GlpR family transcriptional regulator of sugar metabolism